MDVWRSPGQFSERVAELAARCKLRATSFQLQLATAQGGFGVAAGHCHWLFLIGWADHRLALVPNCHRVARRGFRDLACRSELQACSRTSPLDLGLVGIRCGPQPGFWTHRSPGSCLPRVRAIEMVRIDFRLRLAGGGEEQQGPKTCH